MHKHPLWKRIAIDFLGGICILGSILFGWLPGPGGIPLLILGLSLLATNHTWAERLLLRVKKHGLKVSQKLFSDSPRMKLLLDVASIAIITIAVIMLNQATRNITITAAISLLICALFLLLGNRQRFHKVTRKFKK